MMITDIEDYYTKGCGRCERFATPDCSTRCWISGLTALRTICREMGLTEVVKWGHPCFMHAGRNIAIIGAFRDDFRISFFDAVLLTDPEGALERQGPNTRHPDALRFTDNDQVTARAPLLRALLTQAMANADAGLRPPKEAAEFELPDELIEALDCDPDLAEAFHRLTPGRQKSYVFALNSAKTSATKMARIAKYRPAILAGRGALDRA